MIEIELRSGWLLSQVEQASLVSDLNAKGIEVLFLGKEEKDNFWELLTHHSYWRGTGDLNQFRVQLPIYFKKQMIIVDMVGRRILTQTKNQFNLVMEKEWLANSFEVSLIDEGYGILNLLYNSSSGNIPPSPHPSCCQIL